MLKSILSRFVGRQEARRVRNVRQNRSWRFEALEARQLLAAVVAGQALPDFVDASASPVVDCSVVVPNRDINGDGRVTPVDALTLINQVNIHGGSFRIDFSNSFQIWYDTDGNGWVTPADVVNVINDLNSAGSHEVVFGCSRSFVINYNKITDDGSTTGDIVVKPGQENVHIVSAFVGAKDEIGFLKLVDISPHVTEYATLFVNGQMVGSSTTGQFVFASNPIILPQSGGVTLDVYATAPKQDGGYYFSINASNTQIEMFPGATAVINESNLENRRVVTVSSTLVSEIKVVKTADYFALAHDMVLAEIDWSTTNLSRTDDVMIEARGGNIIDSWPVFENVRLAIDGGGVVAWTGYNSSYSIDNSSGSPKPYVRTVFDIPDFQLPASGKAWVIADAKQNKWFDQFRVSVTDKVNGADTIFATGDWMQIVYG